MRVSSIRVVPFSPQFMQSDSISVGIWSASMSEKPMGWSAGGAEDDDDEEVEASVVVVVVVVVVSAMAVGVGGEGGQQATEPPTATSRYQQHRQQRVAGSAIDHSATTPPPVGPLPRLPILTAIPSIPSREVVWISARNQGWHASSFAGYHGEVGSLVSRCQSDTKQLSLARSPSRCYCSLSLSVSLLCESVP